MHERSSLSVDCVQTGPFLRQIVTSMISHGQGALCNWAIFLRGLFRETVLTTQIPRHMPTHLSDSVGFFPELVNR